jgi:hypothetical protein
VRAVVNMRLGARCRCVLCVRSATGNGEKAKQTYILDIRYMYMYVYMFVYLCVLPNRQVILVKTDGDRIV